MVNAANGKLITSDGRSVIVEDDSGKKFPWIPGPFLEVVKGKFCKGIKGKEVDTEHLRGKTLGVYFSAYWVRSSKWCAYIGLFMLSYENSYGQKLHFRDLENLPVHMNSVDLSS